MEILVHVLLFALAAFRLAELIVIDDGPFDIFLNLRGMHTKTKFDNSLRRQFVNILICVHCAGFWISIFFGVAYYFIFHPPILIGIAFPFAVAAVQSIFANKLGRQG